MRERRYYAYMMTNQGNTTLYTGFTHDLCRRVWEHKERPSGFAKRYKTNRLVWYELHETFDGAVNREKNLKNYHRAWKDKLIDTFNPQWLDLYATLVPDN